jgi:zinc protease
VVERPVPQSVVQMALPGIARQDPDWYPAFIMNHVLGGGGQQSRLFTEVREKRGLTYGISSSLRTWAKAALLNISTASANEKVADTIRVVRAEMARLRNEGVTVEFDRRSSAQPAGRRPAARSAREASQIDCSRDGGRRATHGASPVA